MRDSSELVDLGGAAAVLASAAGSGLLQALLERPAGADGYAAELGLDPGATALVLDALQALGVAERSDGEYAASQALHLIADLNGDGNVAALWSHLPSFLSDGEPLVTMNGNAGERGDAYRDVVARLAVMFAPSAEELAARLDGDPARILDIGAGSGIWSLKMAAGSEAARVTALDLPEVLPNFLTLAGELGLDERVETIAGDYLETELPGGFDRVVLANVLHLEPEPRARALVARAARALAPGGELVIIDALAGETPEQRQAQALYALHLAMRTRGGRNHPREEVEAWCREAGLEPARLIAMDVPPRALAALVASPA